MFIFVAFAAPTCSGKEPASTAWSKPETSVADKLAHATTESLQVGNLGDPAKLVFAGVEAFPIEDIRKALQFDLKYQAASRPSNDTGKFLQMLEERVRLGYLQGGFPEAKVRAWCNSKVPAIVVEVEEGPGFVQGQVIVEGADVVDSAALKEWLAKPPVVPNWTLRVGSVELPKLPDDATAGWIPGERLIDTPETHAALRTSVRWALADQGLLDGSFHTSCEPAKDPGVSDLRISFISSPQPAKLNSIEINGLKRDSQEQLLKYLKIAVGTPADGKVLRRLDQRLAESCRYWNYKIALETVAESISGHQALPGKLILDVEEFTHAPPLDQPLPAADEILRKAATWLARLSDPASGMTIRCTGKIADEEDPDLSIELCSLVLAQDGRLIADVKYSSSECAAEHALTVGAESVELIDWKRRERFSLPLALRPKVEIRVQPERMQNGDYAQGLFVGYALASSAPLTPQPVLNLQIVPVALVYLAHRPGVSHVIQDGKLTLSADNLVVEFDAATGAFLEARVKSYERETDCLVLRAEQTAFSEAVATVQSRSEEFPNRFDSVHPVSSSLDFVLDQLQSQPCVVDSAKLTVECDCIHAWLNHPVVVATLHQVDRRFAAFDRSAASDKVSFSIPDSRLPADDGFDALWDGVAWCSIVGADQLFPRASWPWTLMREYGFDHFADAGANRREVADFEFSKQENERFFSSDILGPISSLLFMKIAGYQSAEPVTEKKLDDFFEKRFAEIGLKSLSDEDFLNDVRILTAEETEVSKLCCTAAEKFCSCSNAEQTQLQEALPEVCRPLLMAVGKRRTANPEEPIAKTIEAALLDDWRNRLRDLVETQLRAHSTRTAEAPADELQR